MWWDPKNPPNWIGTQNPWLMPRPPIHWLRRLWDRDDQLRLLPGLAEPCYRVARVSRVMRSIVPARGNDSETGRMCREGVVPVVTLKPTVTWNDDFFIWLNQSDLWTLPKNASDYVEEKEAEANEKRNAQLTDELDQVSVSAYDAMKWRTGQQVLVQAPNAESPCSPVAADNNKQPGCPLHAAPGPETCENGSLP